VSWIANAVAVVVWDVVFFPLVAAVVVWEVVDDDYVSAVCAVVWVALMAADVAFAVFCVVALLSAAPALVLVDIPSVAAQHQLSLSRQWRLKWNMTPLLGENSSLV